MFCFIFADCRRKFKYSFRKSGAALSYKDIFVWHSGKYIVSSISNELNNEMTTVCRNILLFIGSRDFTDFIFSDGSDLQVHGLVALLRVAPSKSLDHCSCEYT